jgi:chitosanase
VGTRGRTIALGTAVAAVLCVPLGVTVAANAATEVLLSAGRPAAASSTFGPGYAARLGVDGDVRTRWASVSGAGTQWLRVDLGVAQTVDRVRLLWERAYARAYRIQASADGVSWTTIYSTASGNGGVDDLAGLHGSGRYLRIVATVRGTPYGYSLWEAQVFGPGPAAPAGSGGAGATPSGTGLTDPKKKEYAMELVSSAENSTLNWRGEYGYVEDIGDGRGYTGGLVGFCSGTSDMLAVVSEYTRRKPGNGLARYLPALRTVDGSDSHAGLDPGFPAAWRAAAADPVFQKVQEDERDALYFHPAVALAVGDGVRALGQFAYYDAAVMHGVSGLRGIRAAALRRAKTPALGGDEVTWLNAFLDARVAEMRTEEAHSDTSRVDHAQRAFLAAGNLDLDPPLSWSVYGDGYAITR